MRYVSSARAMNVIVTIRRTGACFAGGGSLFLKHVTFAWQGPVEKQAQFFVAAALDLGYTMFWSVRVGIMVIDQKSACL